MTVKEEFSFKSEIFDWFEAICFSIVAVILVFTFVFRTAQVEGSSMLPNLKDNDRVVLVNSAITGLKQGDVVVTTQPSTVVNHPLIKRVIATEGQTVRVDYENDMVYVDGKAIDEPYILEQDLVKLPNTMDEEFTVSEGHVFVMGDNRNDSADSRNKSIGEINEKYVMGKAFLRIFPFNAITLL